MVQTTETDQRNVYRGVDGSRWDAVLLMFEAVASVTGRTAAITSWSNETRGTAAPRNSSPRLRLFAKRSQYFDLRRPLQKRPVVAANVTRIRKHYSTGLGRAWRGLDRAYVLGPARFVPSFCEVVLIDSHSFWAGSGRGQRADTLGNYGGARPRPVRRCPGHRRCRPIIGRQQLVGRPRPAGRSSVRPIAWPITMMDDDGRVTDLKDSSNCFTTLTPAASFYSTLLPNCRDTIMSLLRQSSLSLFLPAVHVAACTHDMQPITLVPATVFLQRLPATGGGKNTPRHILSSRAHSEKIPTATPHAF